MSQPELLLCLCVGFIVGFPNTLLPASLALWPLGFTLCKLNLERRPQLRAELLLAAVDPGNPPKAVMLIIIITEAPWRPDDAIHHDPQSIFPAGLPPPLQPCSSPLAMDLWSCSQ